jgi:hypothetical protein
MAACLFILAALFFFIGVVTLLSPEPRSASATPASPIGARTQSLRPTPPISTPPAAPSRGVSMAPSSLDNIRVGERIRVRHPVQGELTVYVMGQVVFEELWQQQRSPQAPWVPTGSLFRGFWLETNLLLLNWQNRYYLLDEATAISDPEIQRDFAPHAKKFAQSDQTADVYFAYPPASWHIDDIGKFRVRSVDGEGLRSVPGATGRFVHASGDGQRALVLEDYEGGGAQDMVWTGYQINKDDIQP